MNDKAVDTTELKMFTIRVTRRVITDLDIIAHNEAELARIIKRDEVLADLATDEFEYSGENDEYTIWTFRDTTPTEDDEYQSLLSEEWEHLKPKERYADEE